MGVKWRLKSGDTRLLLVDRGIDRSTFAAMYRHYPGRYAMDRPSLGRVDRVRVELRLPPATARALYEYATGRAVSLSGAGAELIEAALEFHNHPGRAYRRSSGSPGRQTDSRRHTCGEEVDLE